MANYDTVDMVKCTLSISTKKHLANTMLVSRAPKIKLIAGDEVLWTYNISSRERLTGVQFFHEKEWKLVKAHYAPFGSDTFFFQKC